MKSIQEELQHHLRPIPIDEPNEHEATDAIGQQAIETLKAEAEDIYAVTDGREQGAGGREESDVQHRLAAPQLPAPSLRRRWRSWMR